MNGISLISVHFNNSQIFIDCFNESIKRLNELELLWELIIVDNSDSLNDALIIKDWAEKYENVIYSKSESNYGFGKGCNNGSKIAKYDILWFINSDAYIYSMNKISSLLNKINSDSSIALVATAVIDANNGVTPQGGSNLSFLDVFAQNLRLGKYFSRISKIFPLIKYLRPNYFSIETLPLIREIKGVGGASFFIRKSIFQYLNGFDENYFLYDEDGDISLRAIDNGYSNLYFGYISVYTKTSSTTSKLPKKELRLIKYKSRVYFINKHFNGLKKLILLSSAHICKNRF